MTAPIYGTDARFSPIVAPSSLLQIGPSQCFASVLSPFCALLSSKQLVPAVPCDSLHLRNGTICPVLGLWGAKIRSGGAFAAFALIEINDRIIMEPAFNELHQIYECAA